MTAVRPIARPLVGLLLLAGLAFYAAASAIDALAPSGGSITITQKVYTSSPATTTSDHGQAPSPARSGAEPAAPGPPPDGFVGPASTATERFADGGPAVVGRAAPQGTQSCGYKFCPRPLR